MLTFSASHIGQIYHLETYNVEEVITDEYEVVHTTTVAFEDLEEITDIALADDRHDFNSLDEGEKAEQLTKAAG